jgi:hypothetical protein
VLLVHPVLLDPQVVPVLLVYLVRRVMLVRLVLLVLLVFLVHLVFLDHQVLLVSLVQKPLCLTLQLSAKVRKDGFNVNNTSFLRLQKLSGAETTTYHVQKYQQVSQLTDFAKPTQKTRFKRSKVSVKTNKLARSSPPIFSSMITVAATFTSTLKFGTSASLTKQMRLMY